MGIPEQRSDATTAMAPADWSIERAAQYYNVNGWGAGFFSVNERGHVVVHPMGQPGPTIDLMDVVEDIRERRIGFPCVVRFQDVLRARVKQINEAFGRAIAEMGYGARYYGVYPIKVNQMREVVEEILAAGGKPFLTDTNTLYVGSRSNAADHLRTAVQNGFAFAVVDAPVVIAGTTPYTQAAWPEIAHFRLYPSANSLPSRSRHS